MTGMDRSGVIIIGASGHGRMALDILRATGVGVLGFVDHALAPGASVDGIPVIAQDPAACSLLVEGGGGWFVAIGENRTRQRVFGLIAALTRAPAASLVHPSAVICGNVTVGKGVFVGPGAVVNTGARLLDGVILNTAATVDHDCRLEAFSQICPGCHLAGNVVVKERGFLGTGANVIPGLTIGEDAVVGAGAAVIRDIPAGALAVGVPARIRPRS